MDIKCSQIDYEHEIEIEYGIPTEISEVSVSRGNIFGGSIITGLFIRANFSSNNASIWVEDQFNDTIWQDFLNGTIERYVNVNSSSIRKYILWVNSTTVGNRTLYFTFRADIFMAENFGLGIFLILLPIIIVFSIVFGIKYGKTRLPSSLIRRWFKGIIIRNGKVRFIFYHSRGKENIRKFLSKMIIWIENTLFFDIKTYPNDFDVDLNGVLYKNQNLDQISEYRIQKGDKIRLITPNRTQISSGWYKIYMGKNRGIYFSMNIRASE
ncbi:MAG: hypothetical protein ACFFA3_21045 [Promethearchaeota archaeon]